MRKLAGAIFAIVLMATAAGVWSSLSPAAGLVGAYDPALREQPSAGAQVADRFPRETERLRAFAFIQPPAPIDAVRTTRAGARQPVMTPGCAQSVWPFMAQQCLPTPAAKLAPAPERAVAAERAVAPERRTTGIAAAPVRTAAATAAAIPAAAAATAAAAAASPACKQNLAAATARVEKALAHIKSQRRDRADACTAYRQDFFELVRAREMTAQCKTGAERDQDLGRIDLAVEDVNGAIAQSCGG